MFIPIMKYSDYHLSFLWEFILLMKNRNFPQGQHHLKREEMNRFSNSCSQNKKIIIQYERLDKQNDYKKMATLLPGRVSLLNLKINIY